VARPAFVGVGTPIYTAPGPVVPASFTVTPADLPAGIAANDLLFVLVLIGGNGVPANPYDSADLDAAGYVNASTVTAPSRQAFILCWAGFYDSADFPATIDLTGGDGDSPSTARVETVAYRNVETLPDFTTPYYRTAGSSISATLPDPNTTAAVPISTTDGLVVQFTYESALPASGTDVDDGFDVGTVSDAEGHTERHRQARILDFGGGFVVADTEGLTPQFATYNTVNNNHVGACMSIGLDGKALAGWVVGSVGW